MFRRVYSKIIAVGLQRRELFLSGAALGVGAINLVTTCKTNERTIQVQQSVQQLAEQVEIVKGIQEGTLIPIFESNQKQ